MKQVDNGAAVGLLFYFREGLLLAESPRSGTPHKRGFLWCAWHDAQAAVPGESLEHDGPPLPDGRTTPTRQGHCQRWGVWRKHEAEPVYV